VTGVRQVCDRCVTGVRQVCDRCVTGVFQVCCRCLTPASPVLQVDVQQDAAVAAAHGQQGEHVQRAEVDHVVGRLLPAAAEAAVRRTLSEVHGLHPHRPEHQELGSGVRGQGSGGSSRGQEGPEGPVGG